MKKLISILCIFCLLMAEIAFLTFADATEMTDETLTASEIGAQYKIGLLSALEIFDDEYDLDETLTRAEVAQVFTRLMGDAVTLSAYTDTIYDDVTDETEGYESINYLYRLGVMNGKTPTSFYPDDDVSYTEALVSLVRLLGYEEVAKAKGGYSVGYLAVANTLGLTDNIPKNLIEDEFCAGALAVMIYNALDVRIVNSYILSNSNVTIDGSYSTIMDSYLYISRATGMVNAYRNLNLFDIDEEMLPSEFVEIGGVKFEYEFDEIIDYFGYNVEYFYKKNKDLNYDTVLYAFPEKEVKTKRIFSEDIYAADSNVIKVRREDTKKEENYKLSANPVILFNGYPVKNLSVPKNGYIDIISNDGLKYDIVLIFDFESAVVKSASEGEYRFKYGKKINGDAVLDLDLEEGTVKYTIIDGDEYGEPDSIKADSVISVAYNDKVGYFIYVSNEKVSGEITELQTNPERFIINDEPYKIDADFKAISDAKMYKTTKLDVSVDSTFDLDFMGKITGMESTDGTDYIYGYLDGIDDKQLSFEGYSEVRIFSSKTNEFSVYTLTDKTKYNGKKSTASEVSAGLENYLTNIIPKYRAEYDNYDPLDNPEIIREYYYVPPIVKFTSNSKNEITDIVDNLTVCNANQFDFDISDNRIILSVRGHSDRFVQSFGYFNAALSLTNGCVYAADSLAMRINILDDEDDFKIGIVKNIFPNSDQAASKPIMFDLQPNGVPRFVVYPVGVAAASVAVQSTLYGFISASSVVNSDGEIGAKLNLISSSGVEDSFTTTAEAYTKALALQKGDFIWLKLDANGNVSDLEVAINYEGKGFKRDDYLDPARKQTPDIPGDTVGRIYNIVQGSQSGCGIGLVRFKSFDEKSGGENIITYYEPTDEVYNYTAPTQKYQKCKKRYKKDVLLSYDGNEYKKASLADVEQGGYIFFVQYDGDIWQAVWLKDATFFDQQHEFLATNQS